MLNYFITCTVFIPSLMRGEYADDLSNYTEYIDDIVDNVTFVVTDDSVMMIDDVNLKGSNHFHNYVGDLVGWRDVTAVEFPFVVGIMHAEYLVHVCTGVLVTLEAVLTFMRCVIRKKTVAGKVSQKLVELSSLAVVAGVDNQDNVKDALFRDVTDVVMPYHHTYKGQVIFLMIHAIPYTLLHRPVKLYSTDTDEMSRKFEEEAQNGFCEIVTWRDTILCPNGAFERPKAMKAYKVKVGHPDLCIGQTHSLGIQTIGEWSMMFESRKHCFVGMGGDRCGTAPGAPLVCRGAVYGITALGSSCSEFGDYGYFVALNSSDIRLLFDRAYPTERSAGHRVVHLRSGISFPLSLTVILRNISRIIFLYTMCV